MMLVIRERSDGYVLYTFYLIPDVAKVNRSSEFVLIQSPSLVIGQQVSQNQRADRGWQVWLALLSQTLKGVAAEGHSGKVD